MDNKLSELSKPVATVDVQRGRPDGNMFGAAWSSAGHAIPDGPHFLYSQEYLSALLAELEAKDKRIAELEAKLATPIKIVNYDEFFICHVTGASDDYCKGWVDGRNAAARDVEKAGFTVQGDE